MTGCSIRPPPGHRGAPAAGDSGGVTTPSQPQEIPQQPEPERSESAQPEPGPSGSAPSDSAPARRTAHRALAVALAVGVVGSSLVLLAAGKTWARGTAGGAGQQLAVHASGSQTTALPGALALVGLASLVAVFAVRRLGRYTVAALLALSGIGAAGTALARRADHSALDSAAATATGLTHATASHADSTGWPLVSVAGGVLLLVAGLLALRYGQRWPAMSSRYDRGDGRARVRTPAPVDPDRAEDLWKALDRGEDPTQAPG
jgi:uncharacterized membrane protein (TIGR02234 family)